MKEKSLAMEMLEDYKKANARQFVIILVILGLWALTIGYLVYILNDIGYIDEDERLFITDRKKDMIVMSGWKIYPTEVEETLIKYPKVDEIAIFSITDIHRGELPVAAVVWKEDEEPDGLIAYSKEYLARYKVPRKIFTMEELPRVNGWKLLRRELREMYSTKQEE